MRSDLIFLANSLRISVSDERKLHGFQSRLAVLYDSSDNLAMQRNFLPSGRTPIGSAVWLIIARLLCAALLLCSMAAHAEPGKRVRTLPAGWPWDTIPHIADGDSWTTTLILVNLEDTAAKYKLDLFGDDGKVKAFNIVGRGAVSSVSGQIPVRGSITLTTTGTATSLNQGWAALDLLGTDDVGIMAIFRQQAAGRPAYEATVPASSGIDTDSIVPFDNTGGFVTALALLNPSSFSTTSIPIEILDEAGNRIATDIVRLNAGNKIAFTTADRWPGTAGRRGTIQLADGLYSVAVLGFRFSPTGAFTTLAVMDR